ncbi:hypothetical protein OHN37_05225 [Streptomyces sp. NBC_00485]|nr:MULTISPECIES: hypothetical protein [unclassified Streptomyces]MCX5053351.1 hypothetical protein [Streptomyces sp. NBC_00474]MCX5059381.1 hypothetical protein [Streptomyces sp. NBC_00452]
MTGSTVDHGQGSRMPGMPAGTFGLAGDPQGVVTSGCGLRVPYAMATYRKRGTVTYT